MSFKGNSKGRRFSKPSYLSHIVRHSGFFMRSKHLQDDHHTVSVSRSGWRSGRSWLNLIAAISFLTVGVLIPLTSALNRERWAGAERTSQHGQAQEAIQPPVFTNTASGFQATPRLPSALPAAPTPALIATGVAISTLMPIVPSIVPGVVASEPVQPPQSSVAAGQSKSGPILMYHYIRYVDAANDELGYNLSIDPETFDHHMAWLANNGYTGVDLHTLLRCTGRIPSSQATDMCPAAPVALTFDDGYMDAYTAALPILQRYGFRASFYIVTGFVGQPGYMGWKELIILRDAGMEIGSHSISHPNLTELDQAELARQINESKQELEQQLHIRVTSFCYPTGAYNQETIEQLRLAGFENAITTNWYAGDSDLMSLARRRVTGGTSTENLSWIIQSE